ncbi:MAG: sporulation protein YqfD, partial [Clostridia bacterium]|nr:sporulation protein YqfD [Clostridia bacterium]
MNLKQTSVKETGKTQKKYCIKINNFEINLNKRLPKFQKYDTINEDKKMKLFSDFYLPITLGISTYYELEEENNLYT